MSKNIRQKIAHAILTTFRSSSSSQVKQSSTKSKISSCCSISKSKDYEYIPYQSPTHSDYIDLSECHSQFISSPRDSGISSDSNISSITSLKENCHQLQSTRTHCDESHSFSSLSNLSCIPHEQMNISNFDVTAWHSIPTSFECCHCECRHDVNNNLPHNEMDNYLYVPEEHRQKRTKYEIFPVVF